MIYILEIPHQRPPQVWTRENAAQIMGVIAEVSAKSGDVIFDKSTVQEILDMFGYESPAEMRDDNTDLTYLAELINTHGLDTVFYKGYGDDVYSIEPVDEFQAYLEWNGHDLSAQRVFMCGKEARAALADDSKWRIHQGAEARTALKYALFD